MTFNVRQFVLSLLLAASCSYAATPEVCRRLNEALAKERTEVKSGDTHFVGHTDAESYATYFAGMDKTNQQKISLAISFLPPEGTIVDLGVGSGQGTADFAALTPRAKVIGVDIDPLVVKHATKNYSRPNTRFMEGNALERVFPPESVNAFNNSSIFHEVATFTDYNIGNVGVALDRQVEALKTGGIIATRDFVAPINGGRKVTIDLPANDGNSSGPANALSTAATFERFAKKFKSSVHRKGGVPYRELPSPRKNWKRYEVDLRSGNEALHHKDYRDTDENFDRETLEEYTYYTQPEFEEAYRSRRLRVLISKPIHNPWIRENRQRGKFEVRELDGKLLPLPPTNHIIVGEKIRPDQPLEISETTSKVIDNPTYLRKVGVRHKGTGEVYDMVARPDDADDIIPWSDENGTISIYRRNGYPRPIINTKDRAPLNHSTTSGFVGDPIAAIRKPDTDTKTAVERVLAEDAGINPEQIISIGKPVTYYPSPGGIAERVSGIPVKIKPSRRPSHRIPGHRSGFSESGAVQPMEAQQVLRSAQVGGMFDARLETNVYGILLDQKRSVGPWIGAEMKLENQVIDRRKIRSAKEVLGQRAAPVFVPTERSAGFLEARRGTFTEKMPDGTSGKSVELEYVVPKKLSTNTVTALPIVRNGGEYYAGIEMRELPTVEMYEGSPTLATAPAFRLPKAIDSLDGAEKFIKQQMPMDFAVSAKKIIPNGGEYYVSLGVTPELTTPFVVEIDAARMERSKLVLVPLKELIDERDSIRDGHLKTAVLRAGHALGLMR